MTIDKLAKHEYFRTQNLEYAFDSLTNVLTRDPFFSYVEYLIKQGSKFVFCLVDIDYFKNINDSYGHLIGDKALETFANGLTELLGDKGIVGRFGGDEFMFVIENVQEYDEVWKIAHELCVRMRKEMKYPVKEQVTFTCGITRHPLDGISFEELFEKTDKALYRGKMKGRNCFIIYLPEKHDKIDINKSRILDKAYVEINQNVFDIIFDKKIDSKTAIENAIKYVMGVNNAEHICIETKDGKFFDVIHKLSNQKSFDHIPISQIEQAVGTHGIFYATQRSVIKPLSESLFYNLVNQNVGSVMFARIHAFDKTYGYIRCEMTSINRMWQLQDVDVISNLARCIGLRIYYDENRDSYLK